MIFRVTQKLARKLKIVPAASLPPHENPLHDWTANLFLVSRWQFILVSNTSCLYSIVVPGKGLSSAGAFADATLKAICHNLALEGIVHIFDTSFATGLPSFSLCKTNDRRVLGSMNDLVFQAKGYLGETHLPIELVNRRLNETPLSMIKYCNPRLSLQTIVDER